MMRDKINVAGSKPDSIIVEDIDLADISAIDLRKVLAEETGYTAHRVELVRNGRRQGNEARPQIIFHAEAGRAGIAWGGDAVWTDAASAEDAAERFFGFDDKEIVN